jgi:hypothetical protein
MEGQQHTQAEFHATLHLEKPTVHQLIEQFTDFMGPKGSSFQDSDHSEL